MAPDEDEGGGGIGRAVLLIGATLGVLFGAGMVAGILAAHFERGGGPMSLALGAILAGSILLAVGSAYLAWRTSRAMAKASGAATPRERRNRIVLVACAVLGMGMGMALSLGGASPLAAFNNDPLPPMLAIVLALLVGVLLPILCVYWHRRVADEQEAAAYRQGALFGIYTYWIGAPTWWLLWRGGFVPAPDGILIYFATIIVVGAIWLWGKYR